MSPCPPDVLGLLPWYSEGTLLCDAERGRVEAHAASCDSCRRELAWMEGSDEPESRSLPHPEQLWARTLSRIAEGDLDRMHPPAHRVLERRGAIAAAVGVLVALGAGLWVGLAWRSDGTGAAADYGVASEARATGSAGSQLDVGFHPNASAERIGSVLRETGAQIVSGPSPVSGIYRVRLAPRADALRAAERLRQEVAGFAEPLAE